jgi:N-acetylglucosaminyldiphosphoundecaprenol N-acetyl-beta-D-mannosaminyltransferase
MKKTNEKTLGRGDFVKFAELLGVKIAVGRREELLRELLRMHGVGGVVNTLNPEIMALSRENAVLSLALSRSFNIPDGIGVGMVLTSRGYQADVYPGVELGEDLLASERVRLAIIGGREGVADRALGRLSQKYPGVTPAFAECGYNIDEEKLSGLMEKERPSAVFVCLGAPRQEIFASRMSERYPGVLFLCLGGSVDVYSGNVRRAPRIIRAMHLEWLWRTVREPSRIVRLGKSLSFFKHL